MTAALRGRRLLVLGATPYQIPLIEAARAAGCHVITADWDLTNPAHRHADECHEVSTTDEAGVVALARRCGIDGVTAFASDPAVLTAAMVAAALDLPGADPVAVERLARKDLFRLLQRESGLPTPEFVAFGCDEVPVLDVGAACVYKPVDGCSSKGITVVQGKEPEVHAAARDRALAQSRCGRAVVEAHVAGVHLHGDGWLESGRLVHHHIGEQRFLSLEGAPVPVGTCWPTRQPAAAVDELVRQVELLAAAAGYHDGPVNIEARVDGAGRVVVIELAPRCGGGFIPEMQWRLTGFDVVPAVLSLALGIRAPQDLPTDPPRIGSHVIVHATRDGLLERLEFGAAVRPFVRAWHDMVLASREVKRLTRSDHRLGVLLLEFADLETQDRIIGDPSSWLTLELATPARQP